MNQDLKELYDKNEDFKLYVDKCCANDGYHKTSTKEEILNTAITKEVVNMYSDNINKLGKNIKSIFNPHGECK